MPVKAPKAKRELVLEYGGIIHDSDNTVESREQKIEEIRSKYGSIFIPPYNDYTIIAGQATACYEMIH